MKDLFYKEKKWDFNASIISIRGNTYRYPLSLYSNHNIIKLAPYGICHILPIKLELLKKGINLYDTSHLFTFDDILDISYIREAIHHYKKIYIEHDIIDYLIKNKR